MSRETLLCASSVRFTASNRLVLHFPYSARREHKSQAVVVQTRRRVMRPPDAEPVAAALALLPGPLTRSAVFFLCL